ncbi:hypothetical protein ABEV74_03795 [Paenibacillus cisolokensis]|uniref:hypothetical protein n=1 Tax=Paenibacillus cisolokensis TaxID=1658519 RepID=UPI003D2BF9DB
MRNRTSTVIKMHLKDRMSWFFIPWVFVLSFAFAVNYTISFFLDEDLYTGGLASIIIYTNVVGFMTLHQTFPFALGYSIRRTDYFLGTAATVAGFSAISALLLTLLSVIESRWIVNWGTGLHFFHLPYLSDGTVLQRFFIFFIVLLHMYFLGFVLSSVHRRFRMSGILAVFIAFLLLSSIFSFVMLKYNLWIDLWNWLAGHTAFQLSLWLVPLVVLYAALSYWLLRRSAA